MASEIARFQILGILGTGAQGVVVLANDHEDASFEPIVLKVLKRMAADTAALGRLRDEAKILAWLDHPNIVKVHRLLEKDGLPIVVMEHVQGTSAMEQIRANGQLPPAVALEIAYRTALALDAAYHAAGPAGHPMCIVHRDIKPANLLIYVTGEVKVVDFGIATSTFDEAPPTPDGEFMGTPGYIAPERRNGGPDTPAVDVYALGSTLFGMLTGKLLVQPQSGGRHDASLARSAGHLAPQGLEASSVRALRSIVFDMCRYDADARLTLPGLVQRLKAVLTTLGPPDMQAFAESHVAPILGRRPPAKAQGHPYWPDLAFLELGGDVRDVGVVTPGPPRGLALRPVSTPVEIEPILAMISRRPWWWFWSAANDPASLVRALEAMRGTRDPRAVSRAYELTRHADPRVTEAAWDLLAAAC